MTEAAPSRFLIVAGSAQAHALAVARPDAAVHLCSPERTARIWPGEVSTGPLTAEWLRAQNIRAVIEAAHPCDSRVAFDVAAAGRAAGVAHLQLVRPEWRAGRGDLWVPVNRVQTVAQVIPPTARVFATLGRGALPGLRGLRGPVFVRVMVPARGGFPLWRGRFVPGQGPFRVAQEVALLRRLRIDWLVLRNAGGGGGWPKLEAARRLGLPVAMIARPDRPSGPRVDSVKEALAWLHRQER